MERGAQAAGPGQPQRAHRGAGPRRRRARRARAAQRVGHRLLRRHRRPAGRRVAPSGRASWPRSAATGRRPPRRRPRGGARVVLLRPAWCCPRPAALLGRLRPLFRFALGGRLGSGAQYLPWISLDDEVGAIRFLLENGPISGPVNLVGPEPVTNAEFTRALARRSAGRRRSRCPRSRSNAAGQMAEEMVLSGQRVVPGVLDAAGYQFRHRHGRRGAGGGGRLVTAHDVVVVGAGLAGLRAAQVLCRRGLDVVVLDAADRPGGRVATDVVDGFRCDRGFQVLNTSYPALRAAADLDALDLRAVRPGGRRSAGPTAAAHLRRPAAAPALAPRMTVDRLVPLRDKAKLAAWTARVLAGGPRRVAAHGGRSAADDLAAAGVRGPVARPVAAAVPVRECSARPSSRRPRRSCGWSGGLRARHDRRAGRRHGRLAGAAGRRAAGRRAAAGPPGGRRPQRSRARRTATSSRRARWSSRRTR